jgi:hypothetical protein
MVQISNQGHADRFGWKRWGEHDAPQNGSSIFAVWSLLFVFQDVDAAGRVRIQLLESFDTTKPGCGIANDRVKERNVVLVLG